MAWSAVSFAKMVANGSKLLKLPIAMAGHRPTGGKSMRAALWTLGLSIPLALAACGGPSGTIETEDGEEISYDVDSDGEGATVKISGEGGDAVSRSGDDISVDLPSGWSVYPGAKVVNVMNITSEDGPAMTVMMETDADPDKIIAHYREQAEAAGIKIEMEMTTAGSSMMGGSDEEDRNFSINVMGDPGEDQIANLALKGFE